MTNESETVYFHGEHKDGDTIRGLSAYETMAEFISFQHEIRNRVLAITGAKDVRPAFMVDDETKPNMLSLNIFVHYHPEQPYVNRYWPWIDIDVNDLMDHKRFLEAIVEKITNEYTLHLKPVATENESLEHTDTGDQHQHS